MVRIGFKKTNLSWDVRGLWDRESIWQVGTRSQVWTGENGLWWEGGRKEVNLRVISGK